MTKTKQLILLLICAVTVFTACSKPEKRNTEDFDEAGQFIKDTTAIRTFITSRKIPALKDEKTGLFYQILTPGNGKATYKGAVTVNYTGSLLDGTVIDETKGSPRTFKPLGELILGWQIGIPLIQPGGRIRLIIPSGLGYGNDRTKPFAPNSNLDFTIDVISAD
ncbi:FKBP-type peptidyl-prolyl cis-trans isomerase [Pedobacter sp. NJ-S-72]